MRFEDRLARTASSLIGLSVLVGFAGCSGETKGGGSGTTGETGTTTTEVDLQGMCGGEVPPEDYQLATGFVVGIANDDFVPGTPRDAQSRKQRFTHQPAAHHGLEAKGALFLLVRSFSPPLFLSSSG